MADQIDPTSTPLGIYDQPNTGRITGLEITAAIASVVWLLVAGGYALLSGGDESDGLRFLLLSMVIIFPIALIWVAATAARASRIMREESARLQVAIDAIRKAYVAQQQTAVTGDMMPLISRKLDALEAAQRKTETAVTMLGSSRVMAEAAPPPAAEATSEPAAHQPTLALGTAVEEIAPPLSRADFIRALHFPETADDTEGFDALRRALQDRDSAQLVQAAQDVLTLLSQDGIYMDDLRPDRARPEVWRKFAKGERGRMVAGMGGIRDRTSLALATARLKGDPIFRDAVHHFLRRFDKSFHRFEQDATDAEIQDFAATRTARAFMLLGRVAGTFD